MKYCDAEAFTRLEALVKQRLESSDEDAAEDLSALKSAALSFAEYVYCVCEERIELRFAGGVLKGQEYRSLAERYDGTRHTAHEAAIVNVRMVNRIAALYETEPVFLGNPEDRREVGEFCLEFASGLFEKRYDGAAGVSCTFPTQRESCKEHFKVKQKETIVDTMTALFDHDYNEEMYLASKFREGFAEGIEIVARVSKLCRHITEAGMPLQDAVKESGLSQQEFLEIASKIGYDFG